MAGVPQPRTPRCWRHHVRMASCPDCEQQHEAEKAAAEKRLKATP